MTQKKYKVRRGDMVEVIAGKEKGKRGEIASIDTSSDRVFVKGVNMVTRFAKQSATNPNGVFQKEASIHVSNVALVNPETNVVSKVGFRFDKDGKKERFFKSNNTSV